MHAVRWELIDSNDVPDLREEYSVPDTALTNPTWEELVALEPRLAELYTEARAVRRTRRFCANAVWVRQFKPRLLRLAGWYAEKPELRTTGAYDVAYRTLYAALPDCRGCLCPPVPPRTARRWLKRLEGSDLAV